MSSQIRQNDPTEVEAAANRLATCCCGPHTYLSLGDPDDVAMEGRGHFFRELVEKQLRALSSLKLQNQRGGRILFQAELKPPKVSGQSSGCHGGRPGLGEEPDPGPLGAAGPGSPAQTLSSDFLGNHFLGEEVKLIKKMGDTWLTPTGCGPQAGPGQELFQEQAAPTGLTDALCWLPSPGYKQRPPPPPGKPPFPKRTAPWKVSAGSKMLG